MSECPFQPPKPKKNKFAVFLPATLIKMRGNVLSIFSAQSYKLKMAKIPLLSRAVYFINAPETFKPILKDKEMNFPKSQQFIRLLWPLVQDSIFTSNGDTWLRRRKMVEPAFANLKLTRAFDDMKNACEGMVKRFKDDADKGREISLDKAMARVTADIIYRSICSRPMTDSESENAYTAFNSYIESTPQWDLVDFLKLPNWIPRRSRKKAFAAAALLRKQMSGLIEERQTGLVNGQGPFEDMLSVLMTAEDDQGVAFTEEEIIDELTVLFMAGHETSAAGLTWAAYLLPHYQDHLDSLRLETGPLVGEDLTFSEVNKLKKTKNIFKESLRLYPPISVFSREVVKPRKIRRWHVGKNALIMIAPWLIHRHEEFWQNPDDFDPDRFSDKANAKSVSECFIPFSMGLRVCPGAAFALLEGPMILAYLFHNFDLEIVAGQTVTPQVRVSTRPASEIKIRLHRRSDDN